MIPIADVVPTRTPPRVTWGLMALHAAGLGLTATAALTGAGRLPAVPPADAPMALAAVMALAVPPGWLQSFASLWALWLLGPTVEDRLGHGRLALLYVLTGVTAMAVQVWLSPMHGLPLAGAGGAVAGVLGAHVALFPTGRILAAALVPWRFELLEPPALAFIGAWLLAHLFGGTDLFALVAGGLTGAAAGRLLARPDRMQPAWWLAAGAAADVAGDE